MAGLPGESYAELITEVFTWFTNRDGYERLTKEIKIERLTKGVKVCLDAKDYAGADLLFSELRRVLSNAGN